MTVVHLAFEVCHTPSSLAILESVVEMIRRGAVVRAASSIDRFIMQTSVIQRRIRLLKYRFSEKFSNTGTISTGKKRVCAFIAPVDKSLNGTRVSSLVTLHLLKTSRDPRVQDRF
jgi:hypothetical protein